MSARALSAPSVVYKSTPVTVTTVTGDNRPRHATLEPQRFSFNVNPHHPPSLEHDAGPVLPPSSRFLFAPMGHRYGTHWYAYLLHSSLSSSRYHSPSHRHANNLRCPDQPFPSNILLSFVCLFLVPSVPRNSPPLQKLGMRFIHCLLVSAFLIASKAIRDDTYSNKSWCIVGQGTFALREINQMEREMCSYLEWQLNVEPNALKEFEAMVRRDFKGPGPYPAHYTLPAPTSGPFAHPKPSTNNIPTAILSFGPGAPPSPPLTTSPVPTDKSSRRSSADAYPVPVESQFPTPPASRSNVPSPVDSMSPATPPNYEGDTAKIVSSAGSNPMQISGDNISPIPPPAHTRKSSPPVSKHPRSQVTIDMKHAPPKKTPSSHKHAAKSNTILPYHHYKTGPLVYWYFIDVCTPHLSLTPYVFQGPEIV